MFCRYCGKELSEQAVICPNCGAIADPEAFRKQFAGAPRGAQTAETEAEAAHRAVEADFSQGPQQEETEIKTPLNVMALVGFILSLCSLALGFLAIPGLVCSIIGYKRVAEYNGNGKAFALTGIIVGIVVIALVVLLVIFYCLFLFAILGAVGSYGSIYF